MKTKDFHLGDILSIITGKLFSPRLMGGVYDILNFMTRDKLSSHQLCRAADECKPYLLEQFPQLKEVDVSGVDEENYKQWLNGRVAKYGEMFSVEPIPSEMHEIKDPLAELIEKKGSKNVIVLAAP